MKIWILVMIVVNVTGGTNVAIEKDVLAFKSAEECYKTKILNERKFEPKYTEVLAECIPKDILWVNL